MVIVLGIIALILGAAVKFGVGIGEAAKYTATKGKMSGVAGKVGAYALVAGRLPTEEQGLKALVERPIIDPVPKKWTKQSKSIPKDAWGNELVYRNPGRDGPGTFELISNGSDGLPGTEDDVSSADEDS